MKVYYAHSISTYNTPIETRDLKLLAQLGFEVFNPNDAIHDEGYREHGMDYFTKLVGKCDALAFRPHPDGSIPAGVAAEIRIAQELNKPVFELPVAIERRTLTVKQTREYLRECGHR